MALVRQDASDCSGSNVDPDASETGGTIWATRLFDGNTSVKVAMTMKPNTTYRVALKCVRPLGEITTDDEGIANVSLAFPTDLVGPVYSFEMSAGRAARQQVPERAGQVSVTAAFAPMHTPASILCRRGRRPRRRRSARSLSEGMMKNISLSFAIAAASLALVLPAAPAHAQASRTWVSGVGDDVNPCSRTAPCKTFAGAISKTALNGEINCLDPGGFGAVTITKSITIDCHEIFASILNSGTNGINIPFNSFNAADVRKTVRLRNINLNGVNTGIIGIRITGGGVIAAGVVIIEDCLIDGTFAGAATGISDERTAGGELYVSNTTVRNTGTYRHLHQSGRRVPASASTPRSTTCASRTTTLSRIFVGNNGRVMINRSVVSGNVQIGIAVAASRRRRR